MSPKPDFFIVGAPRCGTTAMYHYLAEHPEVFMPDRKEIHYFGQDLTLSHRRPTSEEYLALFAKAEGYPRIGEASVWYLMSRSAPGEISEFQPDARILVMLRNPFEALYSLHSEMLCNGNENIQDFQQALLAEPDRRANARIPKTFLCKEGLFYREIGRFADQVERYFDIFGRERVQITFFDDFRRDTPTAYRNILSFLGVRADFAPEFKVYNASKRAKNRLLQKYVFQTSWARSFRVRQWIPRTIRDASWKFRVDYQPRPPMSQKSFELLAPVLIPQIDKLEKLLDRDLSSWRQPPKK